MENTNVNVAPVVEPVAAPAPVAPVVAAPAKKKTDPLDYAVGGFAIAGVVETVGLAVYFGIKFGKKIKENIDAKKAAQNATQSAQKPETAPEAPKAEEKPVEN